MAIDPDPAIHVVKAQIARATQGWAAAKSLNDIRTGFDSMFSEQAPLALDTFSIGTIPAAFIASSVASSADRTILYCHGGGFQIGSLRSHFGLMQRLADAASARVLGFEYRLAPEHKCPAASDDAFSVYRWLLGATHAATRIAIAGDSAGAALAVQTALRARDEDLPRPACLALISPWLDLSMRGESYVSRAAVDIFSKPKQLSLMARAYLGRDRDARDPLASPLEASLTGMPPVMIHAGSDDITVDDTVLFVERAKRAGVDACHRIWPGMFHHFQMFDQLQASRVSIAELGRFIRERT